MTDLRRVHCIQFSYHKLTKISIVGCRSLGSISSTHTLLLWELPPLHVGAPLAIVILNYNILLIRGDCIRVRPMTSETNQIIFRELRHLELRYYLDTTKILLTRVLELKKVADVALEGHLLSGQRSRDKWPQGLRESVGVLVLDGFLV